MDFLIEEPCFTGIGTAATRPHAVSVLVSGPTIVFVGGKCKNSTQKSTILTLDLNELEFCEEDCTGDHLGSLTGHAVATVAEKSSERIFCVGGYTSDGEPSTDVYELNWNSLSWKKHFKKENAPPGLSGHSLHVAGRNLFTFGGFLLSSNTHPKSKQLCNELYAYNFDSHAWSRDLLQDKDTISPRSGHASCLIPNTHKVVIFGGITEKGPTNDIYILDLDQYTVKRIMPSTDKIPEPRFHASLTAMDAEIFVMFGGADGRQWFGSEGVWLFNLEGEFWYQSSPSYTSTSSPISLASHSAHILSDCLFISGGISEVEGKNLKETLVAADSANVAQAAQSAIQSSDRLICIQLVGLPKTDLFPLRAPKISCAERADTIMNKIVEFNQLCASSEEAEYLDAVLTDRDIQCVRAGIECVITQRNLQENSSQAVAKVSDRLAADLASILLFKFLMWPAETMLPVLDAARHFILLPEVAERFAAAYSNSGNETNVIVNCIAAGYVAGSVKSAPKIFTLRFVSNCFQHRCLHPLLLGDCDKIFECLFVSANSTDDRERLSYAEVLLNYGILLRWRLDSELKEAWFSLCIDLLASEYNRSEPVFFTVLQAFGSAIVRYDRHRRQRSQNVKAFLENVVAANSMSPRVCNLASTVIASLERYDI